MDGWWNATKALVVFIQFCCSCCCCFYCRSRHRGSTIIIHFCIRICDVSPLPSSLFVRHHLAVAVVMLTKTKTTITTTTTTTTTTTKKFEFGVSCCYFVFNMFECLKLLTLFEKKRTKKCWHFVCMCFLCVFRWLWQRRIFNK